MQGQKTELKMTVQVKSADGTEKEYELVGVADMPLEEFKELIEQENK